MRNILGILLIITSSCQTPPKVMNQGNANRVIRGLAGNLESRFQLRPIQEITLENGLQILAIEDKSLPRIRLSLLVKTGARQDTESLQGLNGFMARMLSQGTQHLSQSQFAGAVGNIASELEIEPGDDFTFVSMDTLSTFKVNLLTLFSDAVLNPSFKDVEIERLRKQILADIQQRKDNPGIVAKDEFEKLVYGKSPYGFAAIGTTSTIRKINKKLLLKHYLKYYRPNNSYLAVVGNFDHDFLESVKKQFSVWKKKEILPLEEFKLAQQSGLDVRVKTKEGLQQTQLLLGHSGIPRKHPDYLKARIANEILGGDFVSRLNQRLRVELGLTYGANSSFEVRELAGSFVVSTFTKNESVAQTIQEVRKVLKDFVDGGVNEEELAAAKAQYQGQFPHLIETADSFAQTVMILKFYGISSDYLTNVIENVKSIKVSEINQMVKILIHPEDLKIVVYTDKKALGAQLNNLNPTFIP